MAQTQSETRQVAADQAGKGATGSGSTEPKSNPADLKIQRMVRAQLPTPTRRNC